MTAEAMTSIKDVDQAFWQERMDLALDEARKAFDQGEIPVGAVLVDSQGDILARAGNSPIGLHDPTGHAEILVLRKGAEKLGNYRLPGSVLICTLEPCIMCLGAMIQARVAGLVFGTADPKAGAVVSRMCPEQDLPWLNHRFWVFPGIREQECRGLLQSFFAQRRQSQRRGSEVRS